MADDQAAAKGDTGGGAAGGTGTTDAAAATAATDAAAKAAADTAAAAAAKATETDGKDTGSKAGDGKPAPKAPDKYALTIPDTDKDHLAQDDLDQIEKIARASNWTNEEAQAAIEEQGLLRRELAARYLAETQADPDIGGDKLAHSQAVSNAVIDRVFPKGDPHREGFLAFLNRAGASNNVHTVRFLTRLGKMMGEDRPGRMGTASSAPATDAQKLYDHPTSRALEGSGSS